MQRALDFDVVQAMRRVSHCWCSGLGPLGSRKSGEAVNEANPRSGTKRLKVALQTPGPLLEWLIEKI
jgi:hypothetical protein